MKRLLNTAIIATLIILAASCTPTLSEQELIERINAAESDIHSYRMDAEMEMTMDMSMYGMQMNLDITSTSVMLVDERARTVLITTTTRAPYGLGGESGAYITDEGSYLLVPSLGWVENPDEDSDYSSLMETTPDDIADIITEGSITIKERTSDHYVIDLEFDMDKILELLGDEYLEEELFTMSESMTYGGTVYVDARTYRIERYILTLEMLVVDEEQSMTMEMVMNYDVRVSMINEDLDIRSPFEDEGLVTTRAPQRQVPLSAMVVGVARDLSRQ